MIGLCKAGSSLPYARTGLLRNQNACESGLKWVVNIVRPNTNCLNLNIEIVYDIIKEKLSKKEKDYKGMC